MVSAGVFVVPMHHEVKWLSTTNGEGFTIRNMIVTAEVGTRQVADLIKHVQAGDEVLLTQGDKPMAKIVPASEKEISSSTTLNIRSIKGHRVLTPVISQEDLAASLHSNGVRRLLTSNPADFAVFKVLETVTP
jgi:antitoxin (DNA-binding transcriptional repressor) of toxin-antitoxin stability system